jgi:hypothetical protein
MPESARKPLVALQSREPHSIRFTPEEWAAIRMCAEDRGFEPAVLVRKLTMYALSIIQAPVLSEASLGIPNNGLRASAEVLAGARRTRRF